MAEPVESGESIEHFARRSTAANERYGQQSRDRYGDALGDALLQYCYIPGCCSRIVFEERRDLVKLMSDKLISGDAEEKALVIDAMREIFEVFPLGVGRELLHAMEVDIIGGTEERYTKALNAFSYVLEAVDTRDLGARY